MTLQEDFLVELQYAAEQVTPVAGLDGVAMARRAVRRERVRRASLTGVGGLALAGAIAGGSLLASPTPTGPASGDVPAGWTRVSTGGVALSVPPGLEPSGEVSGLWTADEDFVQVQPLDKDMPLVPAGSGLTPFDLDVPGAVSAEYIKEPQLETSEQEFVGKLDIHLESGEAVRVSLVWTDRADGEEVFADLVRSVAIVGTELPPEPEAAGELQQLDGYVAAVPDGWAESEIGGLTYAVPPTWVDDEASGTAFPFGSAFRHASADGDASLTISQSADSASWPIEVEASSLYPTYTFPLESADVAQVDSRSEDGILREEVRVRRAGGRGYLAQIEVPDTAEGRALALKLVGTFGLGAGSETLPSADDLPLLPTSDVPEEWTETRWGSLRLAVPPEWADTSTSEGGSWVSDAAEPEKVSVSAGRVENEADVIPPYGYRHDVPGAERAIVQVGEVRGDDGRSTFVGTVVLRDGDDRVVLEYSGPIGGDSEARFGMLVDSLEVAGS